MSSTEVFGSQIAETYDLAYESKDYASECELIADLLSNDPQLPRRILDLGAGTLNHAIPLARAGFEITAVDRSEHMLRQATEKLAVHPELPIDLVNSDIETLDLNVRYDAAICMFNVLGYFLTDEGMVTGLRKVHEHLKPGGLFIADFWYGPAVTEIGMTDRIRSIDRDRQRFLRLSRGRLDQTRTTCSVEIEVLLIEGDRVKNRTLETHEVRYFFPEELADTLSKSGFELFDIRRFPEGRGAPDKGTWNALLLAKSVP